MTEPSISLNPALLARGLDLARQGVALVTDHFKYDFRVAHNAYCSKVIEKYCRARTFLVKEPPQHVSVFYVPASVSVGRRRYEGVDLSKLLKIGRRCIVKGGGGSGKTILMRHLLLDAIERGIAYPVFVELRHYNDTPHEQIDLLKIICSFMRDHGFPLGDDFALKSLQEGLMVILLDGFDEVEYSRRPVFEQQIRAIASKWPCQVVLSSRPDMSLSDWHGFSGVDIAPLELREACELISKIPIPDEDGVRARFIDRLKSGLFRSHQYFLSNPLLLSIMLITYGDSADIPRKSATFYEQAYGALFQKHDALKSGYKRARKTGLDISEFARVFSAFSAITYDRRAVTFTALDACQFMGQALRVSGVGGVKAEDVIEDAKQAICLLIDDGLDISFVHRSFQEYFAARFINEADQDIKTRYISKLEKGEQGLAFEVDNVLKLLHEMSPGLVEDCFLIPGLARLFGKDGQRRLSMSSWRRVLKKLLLSVNLHTDGLTYYSVKDWAAFRLYTFAAKICESRAVAAGRAGRKVGTNALSEMLEASGGTVTFRGLSDKSPVWHELADSPGLFGKSTMERVRSYLVELNALARDRQAVVEDIFS